MPLIALDAQQEQTVLQLLVKHNMQDYTKQVCEIIVEPVPQQILHLLSIFYITGHLRGKAEVLEVMNAKLRSFGKDGH